MNWIEIADGIRAKVIPYAESGVLVLQGDFDPADVEVLAEELRKGQQWEKIVFLPPDAEFQAVTPETDAWIDTLAARVHAQWLTAQEADGYANHRFTTGAENNAFACDRCGKSIYYHSVDLQPWDQLFERGKVERRNWVRWTLAALTEEDAPDRVRCDAEGCTADAAPRGSVQFAEAGRPRALCAEHLRPYAEAFAEAFADPPTDTGEEETP